MMLTEKEKMLAGEVFDATDSLLLARRHEAQCLQAAYNAVPSTDGSQRAELLDRLLGSRGENCRIAAPFRADYGENIHLGRNVEIDRDCSFFDSNRIDIGDDTQIGAGVDIHTQLRLPGPAERSSAEGPLLQSAPVRLGCNVRIGEECTIMPGVTIGDGVIVGPGSIVARSLPAGVEAAGCPCRILRKS